MAFPGEAYIFCMKDGWIINYDALLIFETFSENEKALF